MVPTGLTRLLLFSHSVLGTISISMDTLQRSKLKTLYSSMLVALYLRQAYVLSSYSSEDGPDSDEVMVRLMDVASAVYLLSRSIFNYRTLPRALLSLQSASEQLETYQINNVKPRNIYKTVIFPYCLAHLFLLTSYEIRVRFVFNEGYEFSLETQILRVLTGCIQMLGLATYWIVIEKSLQLNQSLREELNRVAEDPQGEGKLRYQRSATDSNTSSIESYISLSKRFQGTSEHEMYEMCNYYWFHLIVTLFLFTLETPLAIFDLRFPDQKRRRLQQAVLIAMNSLYLLLTAVGCLKNVTLSERNKAEHMKLISAHQMICCNIRNTSLRKELKRQMLAGIHGSHLFSCRLVELDYSLIQDLIDTSILIFSILSTLN